MALFTIYSTATCTWCRQAKALLNRKGLSYEEITLTADNLEDFKAKTNNAKTVPQIFYHEKAWRVKDFADGWIIFTNEDEARAEAEATGALMEEIVNLSKHIGGYEDTKQFVEAWWPDKTPD